MAEGTLHGAENKNGAYEMIAAHSSTSRPTPISIIHLLLPIE